MLFMFNTAPAATIGNGVVYHHNPLRHRFTFHLLVLFKMIQLHHFTLDKSYKHDIYYHPALSVYSDENLIVNQFCLLYKSQIKPMQNFLIFYNRL